MSKATSPSSPSVSRLGSRRPSMAETPNGNTSNNNISDGVASFRSRRPSAFQSVDQLNTEVINLQQQLKEQKKVIRQHEHTIDRLNTDIENINQVYDSEKEITKRYISDIRIQLQSQYDQQLLIERQSLETQRQIYDTEKLDYQRNINDELNKLYEFNYQEHKLQYDRSVDQLTESHNKEIYRLQEIIHIQKNKIDDLHVKVKDFSILETQYERMTYTMLHRARQLRIETLRANRFERLLRYMAIHKFVQLWKHKQSIQNVCANGVEVVNELITNKELAETLKDSDVANMLEKYIQHQKTKNQRKQSIYSIDDVQNQSNNNNDTNNTSIQSLIYPSVVRISDIPQILNLLTDHQHLLFSIVNKLNTRCHGLQNERDSFFHRNNQLTSYSVELEDQLQAKNKELKKLAEHVGVASLQNSNSIHKNSNSSPSQVYRKYHHARNNSSDNLISARRKSVYTYSTSSTDNLNSNHTSTDSNTLIPSPPSQISQCKGLKSYTSSTAVSSLSPEHRSSQSCQLIYTTNRPLRAVEKDSQIMNNDENIPHTNAHPNHNTATLTKVTVNRRKSDVVDSLPMIPQNNGSTTYTHARTSSADATINANHNSITLPPAHNNNNNVLNSNDVPQKSKNVSRKYFSSQDVDNNSMSFTIDNRHHNNHRTDSEHQRICLADRLLHSPYGTSNSNTNKNKLLIVKNNNNNNSNVNHTRHLTLNKIPPSNNTSYSLSSERVTPTIVQTAVL